MEAVSADSLHERNGRNSGILGLAALADESENKFVVDRVIAQKGFEDSPDGKREMYLVKWEGYPDEECTWEPKESFLSPETLEQWERDKSQGHTLSQDALSEIYRKMDAFAKAEARRKKRRRMPKGVLAKKRKRRSAVAFVANKDMSLTSQLELHVRQDSTMDQPMKPRGNTPDAESYSSGHFDGSLGGQTTNSETENVKEMEVEYRAPRSRDLPISTGMKETSGPDSKIHLTQRRHQKTGKNEPAPDLRQLTLKSATDFVAAAGEDIAHILPSGDLRPALTQALSLQHAQPMIRGGDQPEPMHAMSNHAHHEPSTLVAQRDASTFGNVVDFRRTANSNVSGLIQNDRSDVHYLPNGRYWCFGEVLLHLTLHNEVVGDVRVGGLPKWFKSKLISLKVEHQVLVDFRLVEMEQYVALCRGRSNDLIANAYIAPFEDSEAAVAELADSLDYNNRAALWYHPDTPYVLVMYAAASNDWRFLDRGHKFPPQYKIHLALRNSMPHIEALAPKGNEEGQRILTGSGKVMTKPGSQLTRTDSGMAGISMNASDQRTPTIAEKDRTVEIACPNLGSTALSSSKALPNLDDIPRRTRPTEALISIVSGADDVPGGRILPHPNSTNLRHDGGSAESRDECASSSPESERDPNLPFEFMNLTGQAMDTVFQHQFGISYTLLTQPSVMPTSHREMLDPGRARFYLAFPLPCHGELEALRAFLSKHTLPNTICTAVESHGWDRFKTILGDNSDHIGVIIFHEQYTNYSGLPGFGKLLKMVNVNVFNICLGQVLPYSDPPVHIERLFPNGTAILLTESAIMRQPEQTLAIVRWFSQMVKTKRGTWKIVLVPNVRHWLRQVAMHAGAAASCFLDMLTEISELSLGEPITYWSLEDEESEAESLEGGDDDFGKASPVVSPANIPAYSVCRGKSSLLTGTAGEKVLIEWFAGWAALNARKHRKFAAISGISPFLGDWSHRWGHIEVVDLNTYMLQNKIPLQHLSHPVPVAQSPG